MLDVLFDAMLVRRWAVHAAQPLPEFAAGLDTLLAAHRDELPPRLQRFAAWARAVGLWQRYDERAMLDEIFGRLAQRHGRREPLASGSRLLDAMEAEIERAFDRLFPDLARRAQEFRAAGGRPRAGATAAPG
jgi:acyl carrier protein phosphodiesterase